MNMDAQLQQFILEHELDQYATGFGRHIQEEAQSFKRHLARLGKAPRLTQVRSLANALAPRGAVRPAPPDVGERGRSGQAASRKEVTVPPQAYGLARLHELVAGQLRRLKRRSPPAPLTQEQVADADLPDEFWVYVAGRLGGLHTADAAQPGELAQFWAGLRTHYGDTWPEQPDAETAGLIHLRLAETFVHHLTETWEYFDPESEGHDETTL
jgi:hypothetical protein